MTKDLRTMSQIQAEKQKDITRSTPMQLDAAGQEVAKCARYTIDVIDTPVDPKR